MFYSPVLCKSDLFNGVYYVSMRSEVIQNCWNR